MKSISKRIILLIISILLVLSVDYMIIVLIAFQTERYDITSPQTGTIDNILSQGNKYYSRDNYYLLNWGFGNEKESAEKVYSVLSKGEYIKVDKTKQVFVQLLQSRNNSVIMLDNDYRIDECFDKDGSFNNFEPEEGLATWAFCVKEFNTYYLIVNYREKGSVNADNPIGDISTSVFLINNSDDLNDVEKYRSVGDSYSSYSFYPLCLSSSSSTVLKRVICVVFLVLETIAVYILILKKKVKNI